MAFREAAEDTLAYRYAADALKSFAERGLGAANAVSKELERQRGLPADDPKRMPPQEIAQWERMLTEVETWTLTIPALLQQSRVVQHDPVVRDQLWHVFDTIHDRDQFLDEVELLRFRALKGSNRNPFSPLERSVPPEFYELATIATTQWMLRENLRVHPSLRDPNRAADLQEYFRAIEALVDFEVEGSWTVGKAQPLDVFILSQIGERFARFGEGQKARRQEAFENLFKQGRVRVNGVVEQEQPSRSLKVGDEVTIITVHKRSTERVGIGLQGTREAAEKSRRDLNAERTTQNLPAAAEFAFNVRDSMDVWRRLLLEVGGKPDHQRYARQLREDATRFREDFLDRKALEVFRREAQQKMDEAIRDNTRAKKLIEFFTWFTGEPMSDAVTERLTTRPDEFRAVFDRVMAKVEEGFTVVATTENTKVVDDLVRALERMEQGKEVSAEELSPLLMEYGKILLRAGRTMTAIQAWQVAENVPRVGGTGAANNLDLVTRVEGKTLHGWAAGFSPYGYLNTLSYRDAKGRIMIVDPGPSFSERSWSHLWETGKLGVQHAALSVVLTHLLTKIHYLVILAPGLHGIVKAAGTRLAGPATAVIQAELTMYETKEAARYERMKRAGEIVQEVVQALLALQAERKIPPAAKEATAASLARKLRSELAVLFHAAEGKSDIAQLFSGQRDTDVRVDLFLEAHVYTNQILTAIGFPPVAQLDASGTGSLPVTPEELSERVRKAGYEPKISPELRQYLDAKGEDRKLLEDQRKMDRLRNDRDDLRSMTRGKLEEVRREVADGAGRKSSVQELIDGDAYPSTANVGEQARTMREASTAAEMASLYREWTSTPEKQKELLQYALDTILFDHEIKMELANNVKYDAKDVFFSGDRYILGWIPGPHQYIPADYKGDQRHIVERSTLDAWNERARKLIQVPMAKILAVARYLKENPPTEAQVTALLKSDEATKVQKLAGGAAMSEEFLSRWATLRQFADKYAPPERRFHSGEGMVHDSAGKGSRYTLEYRDDGNAKVSIAYEMAPVESVNDAVKSPDEKNFQLRITIEGGDDQWHSKTWRIWGHSFFKNEKFPKEARDRLFDIITKPHTTPDGKIDGDRAGISLGRIMRLFPHSGSARQKLQDRLVPMYGESWDKQTFLRELFSAIEEHGGKVTAETMGAVFEDLRKLQELGMFRYAPEKVQK